MERTTEDYAVIQDLADRDVAVLREKGVQYGRSWLKRGGVGAFMMLARKWDRVENDASKQSFDILKAILVYDESLLDDIRDLRRYLLLVEAEHLARQKGIPPLASCTSSRVSGFNDPDDDNIPF